jgi:hypothetical protein
MTATLEISERAAEPLAPLELAHRSSGPVDVTLYWDAPKSEIVVELIDRAGGASFQLVVPAERALDAFHHPYAYASACDAPKWLRHSDVWAAGARAHAVRVDRSDA